ITAESAAINRARGAIERSLDVERQAVKEILKCKEKSESVQESRLLLLRAPRNAINRSFSPQAPSRLPDFLTNANTTMASHSNDWLAAERQLWREDDGNAPDFSLVLIVLGIRRPPS